MSEEKCKKMIFGDWHSRRCSRKAVNEGYCKQHHPEEEAKRNQKSREDYQRKLDNTPIARARKTIETQQATIAQQEKDIAEFVRFLSEINVCVEVDCARRLDLTTEETVCKNCHKRLTLLAKHPEPSAAEGT